ncbi:MAG TPA: hypothetical protein VD929_07925 [Caulobacteraceae bacterium]|nr:hypothetical protein [Caulobacteraceae bacterium]
MLSRHLYAAAAAVALIAWSGAALAADLRWYSYDPATPQTKKLTGGLTFELDPGMLKMKNKVQRLFSTKGEAVAELKPADGGPISGAALRATIGDAGERTLYAVSPEKHGGALARALCKGQSQAWMAFSPVRRNERLTVHVLALDPEAGNQPFLCATLDYKFRGEWKLPPKRVNRIDDAPVRDPRL